MACQTASRHSGQDVVHSCGSRRASIGSRNVLSHVWYRAESRVVRGRDAHVQFPRRGSGEVIGSKRVWD